MRILLIIQLCAISLCTGCSSVNSNTESVSTVTEDTEDCISLDKIQPPEFMKKFAILYCNNMATDLYWGYAENEITDGYFGQLLAIQVLNIQLLFSLTILKKLIPYL